MINKGTNWKKMFRDFLKIMVAAIIIIFLLGLFVGIPYLIILEQGYVDKCKILCEDKGLDYKDSIKVYDKSLSCECKEPSKHVYDWEYKK